MTYLFFYVLGHTDPHIVFKYTHIENLMKASCFFSTNEVHHRQSLKALL